MTEVIVFPDVEDVLCNWLTSQFAAHDSPLPWATAVPSPRPAAFGRLLRTGGPRGDLFVTDQPQITFEAWAPRESTAVAAIQLCRGLINTLPGQTVDGVVFYQVTEFAGPANLPDTVSGQIRYTYSASILLRGIAL